MRRLLFGLVVTALLAILALVFIYPEPMIAPGKLIDAHATLSSDCFSCHQPLLGSSADRCTVCHEPGRIGLFTTRGIPITGKPVGFHQELIDQNCMACHTDHLGAAAKRAQRSFSHELLKPQVRAACSSCHTKPDDRLHARIDGNCSSCHSPKAWTPAQFDHDRYFRLDRHHDVACNTCHVDHDYSQYSCYGCHEHTRSGVRAEHLEEGLRDFDRCVECHRSADKPEKGGRPEKQDD